MSINRQIAEEAAEWVVQLDEGDLSGKSNVDLADWLSRSPDHVQEFLLAAALVQAVSDLPEVRSEALKKVLGEKAGTVIPLMQRPNTPEIGKPGGRRRILQIAPIAAAALLLVSAASLLVFPSNRYASPQALVYATQTGEQRTVPLEDGSVIYLNTDSEVSVRMEDKQRLVMLERGEALFDVAKDPGRPFRVRAGDHQVEAVGTAFNVYRGPKGLKVVVVEGVIEIAPTHPVAIRTGTGQQGNAPFRLRAGEKVAFSGDGNIRPETADLSMETSWRSRELQFRRTRLDEIIAEYNRYTRRHLVLEDEALASMKFTGTFNIDDPQALIAFLELTVGIQTDRSRPDRIVLRAPNSN